MNIFLHTKAEIIHSQQTQERLKGVLQTERNLFQMEV
jgi:hypothetical protein